MTANPIMVGRKVLAGLERGREIANANKQAQSQERADLILALVAADVLAGKPKRGRAGRIARKLRGMMSERLVHKYLARLSSGADAFGQNGQQITGGPNHETNKSSTGLGRGCTAPQRLHA